MNTVFDKKVSKSLKGFLVIIMYWSHMFNHPERLQREIQWISLFNVGSHTIEELLVPIFHVSVPCFFFIAGYGYYISSLKQKRNVRKQILGLYIKYWIVFAVFVPICSLMGKIKITPISLLLNFSGLSSSYCGEWWFLSTYVEMIIAFSFAEKYIKKHNVKTGIVFVASVVLSFVGYMMNVLPLLGIDIDTLIMQEIYIFLIKQPLFVIGWCLARYNYIDKINEFINAIDSHKKHIFIFLLCLFTFIFPYVKRIPETYLYILYLPIFVYLFSMLYKILPDVINRILEIFGKYSTYMWLCHSILLYKLIQKFIYIPKISIFCWGNLVLLSFGCSLLLVWIEKILYKLPLMRKL